MEHGSLRITADRTDRGIAISRPLPRSALYLLIAVGLVGRAGWGAAIAASILSPALLFVLFEFVFRTPLPKGPLGSLLGMI